jgi:hypothetical protein
MASLFLATKENSQNIFKWINNQCMGIILFVFVNRSELDYFKFYKVLTWKKFLFLVKSATIGLSETLREIKGAAAENHKMSCFNYYRKLQCRLYEAFGNEKIIAVLRNEITQSLLY